MSKSEPTPQAEITPAPEATPEPPATPAPETDWKAEARKWEQRAKDNSTAAARLAEIEESKKSAEQKASEALVAAQSTATEAAAKAMRYEVAAETEGFPMALAARLVGSTAEELQADAARLMALIPKAPEATAPVPPAGPTVPGQQPGGAQTPALVTEADLEALGAAGKHDEINRLRREGRLSHLGVAPSKKR